MTAYGTPEIVDGALRLGAFCVLTKPFDLHDLEVVVRNAYQAAQRH